MICPSWINAEGKKYWKKNAPGLISAGLLNEGNADRFALVCQLWGHTREVNLYDVDPKERGKERMWWIGVLKQYDKYNKEFRTKGTAKPLEQIMKEAFG